MTTLLVPSPMAFLYARSISHTLTPSHIFKSIHLYPLTHRCLSCLFYLAPLASPPLLNEASTYICLPICLSGYLLISGRLCHLQSQSLSPCTRICFCLSPSCLSEFSFHSRLSPLFHKSRNTQPHWQQKSEGTSRMPCLFSYFNDSQCVQTQIVNEFSSAWQQLQHPS